jgi:ABC-type glycerol-3-phosphate transport system substrate-binding protein
MAKSTSRRRILYMITGAVAAVIAGSFAYVYWPKPRPRTEIEYPEQVYKWAEKIREKFAGKTLTIAAVAHPSTEAFKTLTPDFEQLTGIKVDWVTYTEISYFDKILLIASGQEVPFDLMYTAAEVIPGFAKQELVIPIDEYLYNSEYTPEWFNKEDIVPAYFNYMKADGKYYGVPFAGETIFVAYRKDLFEKYNKSPPKTYEELLELAKFFNRKEENLYGVSIRCAKTWEAAWSWISFVYGFGGKWVDVKTLTPRFTDPATINSLKYFVELVKNGPPGIEAYSFEEAWAAFQTGKTAMLVESTAAAPSIEDPQKSAVAGKVGYAKFPRGPAGECAGVWGWGMSIPAGAPKEKREAAWSLLGWLTGELNVDRYLKSGGIVSRLSPLKKMEHVYDKAILETLEVANSPLSGELILAYNLPISFEMTGIVSELVSRAITGEISPEEACRLMNTQIDELLKPYRG